MASGLYVDVLWENASVTDEAMHYKSGLTWSMKTV